MEVRIEIVGEIGERQELLNGTQTITLEGASGDGEWTLSGALSWNLGLVEFAGEGDLTLIRGDGSEVFATLTAARVSEPDGDASDADHTFAATYEIDGGSGEFDSAGGSAEASGMLAGDRFQGAWTLRLSAP